MASRGYKKYMKKEVRNGNPFIKIFVISFFGMLLFFTMMFNYVSKVVTVDTSIGDYKEQSNLDMEDKKIIDMNKLSMIQNEDQGRNFSDLMQNATDERKKQNDDAYSSSAEQKSSISQEPTVNTTPPDVVYKVFIGSYTSSEQAKVAKEIIQESGTGFNPIVKCIGANDYTLQVGIFKNKQSAEAMLTSVQKNNLPGRIVQE